MTDVSVATARRKRLIGIIGAGVAVVVLVVAVGGYVATMGPVAPAVTCTRIDAPDCEAAWRALMAGQGGTTDIFGRNRVVQVEVIGSEFCDYATAEIRYEDPLGVWPMFGIVAINDFC